MSNITSEKVPLHSVLRLNDNDVKEFICGWGAAVINVTITFPINKIIFRQVYSCNINKINEYCCYIRINICIVTYRFWKECQWVPQSGSYPEREYACCIVEFCRLYAKRLCLSV